MWLLIKVQEVHLYYILQRLWFRGLIVNLPFRGNSFYEKVKISGNKMSH